jgi:hypothetical protein
MPSAAALGSAKCQKRTKSQGRPEQADEPALEVLAVGATATTQAAPDGDVGEAAGDEEQWHDLKQPRGQLQSRDGGQGVRADDLVTLDHDGRHQPVAEHHDEQAASRDGVDEPVPIWRRGRADSLGEADRWGIGWHRFILTSWCQGMSRMAQISASTP